MEPTILLSTDPPASADDLRQVLAEAGFAVIDHALGSTPAVDFEPVVVAVIDVGVYVEAAAAQTRRWRVELGDQVVPIAWILPAASTETTIAGLDAGADVCLARPFDPPLFVAQIKSLARCRAAAARLMEKAREARLLGDQLHRAYAQLDGDLEIGRQMCRRVLPRTLPEVGAARFTVCHRPRNRSGSDFFDVRRLDENHVGFFLGDIMGRGAGSTRLGMFIRQTANLKEITGDGYRIVPPEEVLAGVNRDLIEFDLEEPPLAAMLAGWLNGRDGSIAVARAGLPAPVYLPAAGDPQPWVVPGPFLGTADITFQPVRATMLPGDRLIIGSDGTRPDGDPNATTRPDRLLEAVVQYRGLSGQTFVDVIAEDLLPHIPHRDDFTLMVVEMHGAATEH
jgi:serine phosphatase RsbU (regulator of sigma subunit)